MATLTINPAYTDGDTDVTLDGVDFIDTETVTISAPGATPIDVVLSGTTFTTSFDISGCANGLVTVSAVGTTTTGPTTTSFTKADAPAVIGDIAGTDFVTEEVSLSEIDSSEIYTDYKGNAIAGSDIKVGDHLLIEETDGYRKRVYQIVETAGVSAQGEYNFVPYSEFKK